MQHWSCRLHNIVKWTIGLLYVVGDEFNAKGRVNGENEISNENLYNNVCAFQ